MFLKQHIEARIQKYEDEKADFNLTKKIKKLN